MVKEKMSKQEKEEAGTASAPCKDKKCPFHGFLKTRGRVFEGIVKVKREKRLMIEIQRVIFLRKYERYAKAKTRLHAHLPDCLAGSINIGDIIKVKECRPLSKIIHHVVIGKGK